LNWTPKTPSRWSLEMDGTRSTYHLNTTEYSQNGDMPGEYSLLTDFVFKDFVMEVTVRQPEYYNSSNAFADYGVIFGFVDATNFYYFLANKDAGSNELFRVTNGTRYSLLNLGESLISDDDYHTFSCEVVDGYFYFETDDNDWQVEEDFPEGQVGLCSFNDEVYFDHFMITPIVDEPTSGIVNEMPDLDIQVYPNPANDQINIIIPDGIKVKSVILYDMAGKAFHYPVMSNRLTIRTDNLLPGLYILQLPCQHWIMNRKLVIQ